MKSIVTEKESKKQEITFPVIMESESGNIVLFTDTFTGTYIGGVNHDIGHYGDDWICVDDKDHWTRFEGTVTLQND